jgi:hypothetical protein
MGEMKRANAWEERRRAQEEQRVREEGAREQRSRDRFASTVAICASIIAAVRLARDDISKPSPRLVSVVIDCVRLARTILERVVR